MKLAMEICSGLEWKVPKALLRVNHRTLKNQPYGEYFSKRLGNHKPIFFNSGSTKTRASGACQFAIDKWHPEAIINLGTCGVWLKIFIN